jgi:predicted PurR-regulated permease PerM
LVTSGDLERQATEIFYEVELTKWRDIPYVDQFLPVDFDPLKAVLGPLQEALLFLLNNVGHALPGVLNTLVTGSIQVSIYVFAVLTLFMEGPKVLDAMRRLSPMDDAYEARLFTVFKEFSNNLVIGSLATAALQGTVASIGYTIAGGPRVLFAGILTGVFSFVPVVGTAVVWVPVALYVAFEHGVGWGIFLAAWSALVTGSVDNIVKPMFLRGSSNIHPLLIFLAVFGGLTWMGLPGALIGPVVVAGFLALYTIYCEDYLGIEAQVAEASGGPGLLDRLKQRLSTRGEEVRAEDLTDADTDETASQSQSQADEVSRD